MKNCYITEYVHCEQFHDSPFESGLGGGNFADDVII